MDIEVYANISVGLAAVGGRICFGMRRTQIASTLFLFIRRTLSCLDDICLASVNKLSAKGVFPFPFLTCEIRYLL